MDYQSKNKPLLEHIPEEPLRDYILNDIAMTAVRVAMGETSKHKVARCDLCDIDDKTPPCKGNCEDYGFFDGESMNSAMRKIAEILGGRV